MVEILLAVCILLLLLLVVLVILLITKKVGLDLSPVQGAILSVEQSYGRMESAVRGELVTNRGELASSLKNSSDSLMQQLVAGGLSTEQKLEKMRETLEAHRTTVGEQLTQVREAFSASSRQHRDELNASLKGFNDSMVKGMSSMSELQQKQLQAFATQLQKLTESNEQRIDGLKQVVEQKLKDIQVDNTRQLEQMRATVDEKLQTTLNTRLAESFKIVSSQLDQVSKSVGEMQAIGNEVGDLKRALGNIKVRGTWGEVQLGALLEQMLSAQQYTTNYAPRKGNGDRVEFAIRLPGRADDSDESIYLPIDVKWPKEDLARLNDALDHADMAAADAARRQLEIRIKAEAQDISRKYICPPETTAFAIMFLPTEGLFAEVIRIDGLVDYAHQKCKVMIAGPTTICALLNSLQVGFRTLAINQQSAKVAQLLAAIKTEFTKYGEVMEKVQEKLRQASDQVDNVAHRAKQIDRKLKGIVQLPEQQSKDVLMIENVTVDDAGDS